MTWQIIAFFVVMMTIASLIELCADRDMWRSIILLSILAITLTIYAIFPH